MRYLLTLLILFPFLLYSNSFNALIEIDTNGTKKDVVSQNLFGGFTEFLLDYINGPNGIWAQELMDRGFDITNSNESHSIYWKNFIDNSNAYKISLLKGGYNENGEYYQHLNNKDSKGKVGIYQTFVYDDTVIYEIYLYCKSNNTNTKSYIQITDTNFKEILYKIEIDSLTMNWKKYKFLLTRLISLC